MRKRMAGFVTRGQTLIAKGKQKESAKLIIKGLQYYADCVLKALQPYAKADASLIVIVLRHIANEVEKNNGCAEAVKKFEKIIVFPDLEEIEKVQKANRK